MKVFDKIRNYLAADDDYDDEDEDEAYNEYLDSIDSEEEEEEETESVFSKIGSKFKSLLHRNRDDEEAEDDEYEEDEEEVPEIPHSNLSSQNTHLTAASTYRQQVAQRENGYANTVNRQANNANLFGNQTQTSTKPSYPQKVPFTNEHTSVKEDVASDVAVMKPTSFNDSSSICDVIRNGRAIILNFEGADANLAQRIVDFVCGYIYATDGQIHQISGYIFIVASKDIDISGDYTSFLRQNTFGVPTFRQ